MGEAAIPLCEVVMTIGPSTPPPKNPSFNYAPPKATALLKREPMPFHVSRPLSAKRTRRVDLCAAIRKGKKARKHPQKPLPSHAEKQPWRRLKGKWPVRAHACAVATGRMELSSSFAALLFFALKRSGQKLRGGIYLTGAC